MSSALTDPALFSSFIAPAIDRTAISVHNAIDKDRVAALRGENRFHPAALGLFAGMLCGGPISNHEYDELMRYQHFGSSDAFLAGLADRGAVTVAADGSFAATPEALAVAKRLVVLQVEAVTQLFSPKEATLPLLASLLTRAREAAIADPLSSLSRLSGRAWLPDDATDAARIWDCAVVLRMHRSDAHAAAWQQAGHVASEMKGMAPSPERDAIEVRTNEHAATPWTVLSPDERITLLAGLAGLPGTGAPI